MSLPVNTPVKIIARNSRHFDRIGIIYGVERGSRSGKNVYNVNVAYNNGTHMIQTIFFDEDLLKIEGVKHEHRN